MIPNKLFRRATASLYAAIRRRLAPGLRAESFVVNRPISDGFIDSVEVDPSGLIRILGWSRVAFDPAQAPVVSVDGLTVPFLRRFRLRRQDVGAGSNALLPHSGLELNYLVPESILGRECSALTVQLLTGDSLNFELKVKFPSPDYRSLLYSTEVLHRDHIYGSGPPNVAVHPHIVELAKELEGPVLDFGCGRGALVAELRRAKIEAYGLELESEVIRKSIPPELTELITLYDGNLPSPFPDKRFRSVVCSEVLEHIPNFQAAIEDIARLASEKVLLTVPDASAIPLGFRHGSVPWHLMEATHVNFFNQESLEHLLKPYFSSIEFGRIGLARLNDCSYYVSLAAVCAK